LNVVGTALDPFGSLASMGVSWAIEQCEPLREALDWFAGDPEAVEVQACTWDNITADLAVLTDPRETPKTCTASAVACRP
jgi:hypothetical protein